MNKCSLASQNERMTLMGKGQAEDVVTTALATIWPTPSINFH